METNELTSFDWDMFEEIDSEYNELWAHPISDTKAVIQLCLHNPAKPKDRERNIAYVYLDAETKSKIIKVERKFKVAEHEYQVRKAVCMCAMLLYKIPYGTPIIVDWRGRKYYSFPEDYDKWLWHKNQGFERQKSCPIEKLKPWTGKLL